MMDAPKFNVFVVSVATVLAIGLILAAMILGSMIAYGPLRTDCPDREIITNHECSAAATPAK